jgi:hypothetical protein
VVFIFEKKKIIVIIFEFAIATQLRLIQGPLIVICSSVENVVILALFIHVLMDRPLDIST